jgi:hypothetical protein
MVVSGNVGIHATALEHESDESAGLVRESEAVSRFFAVDAEVLPAAAHTGAQGVTR